MALPRFSLAAVLAGAVITFAFVAACSSAPVPPSASDEVVQGECQDVFGGDVCTWGTRTDAGITQFGATLPMTTVEQAPMDEPMAFPPVARAIVPLPADVVAATGFNHLAVNWEFHGHPPGLFMTPHFDFHFYTTPPADVAAIDCADQSKPATGPVDYTLPDIEIPGMGTLVGLCVPQMGMHAMPTAELDVTEPFGASMIIGYYGGALNFLEPMVARTQLMNAESFDMVVPPAPAGTPASVRWPSTFRAEYQPDTRSYRLVFGLR